MAKTAKQIELHDTHHTPGPKGPAHQTAPPHRLAPKMKIMNFREGTEDFKENMLYRAFGEPDFR